MCVTVPLMMSVSFIPAAKAQNGDAEKLLKGMADYVSSQKTLPVSCKDSRCSRTAILVDKGCRRSSLVFLTLSSTCPRDSTHSCQMTFLSTSISRRPMCPAVERSISSRTFDLLVVELPHRWCRHERVEDSRWKLAIVIVGAPQIN
jgi:hypothetical protein